MPEPPLAGQIGPDHDTVCVLKAISQRLKYVLPRTRLAAEASMTSSFKQVATPEWPSGQNRPIAVLNLAPTEIAARY